MIAEQGFDVFLEFAFASLPYVDDDPPLLLDYALQTIVLREAGQRAWAASSGSIPCLRLESASSAD